MRRKTPENSRTFTAIAPTAMTETLLAYGHFCAIFALVAFISCEAALCRPAWLNGEVVLRLARIDMLYGISSGLVLLTGGARVMWGWKGPTWALHQPLLWGKLALFTVIGLLSIHPTLHFLRWRKAWLAQGELPTPEAIRRVRRTVMIEAHLLAVIPLLAAGLARGIGAA